MIAASGSGGPIRTCLGCSRKRIKSELVRLALDEKGRVVWDEQQIRPGRGAYICPSRVCLKAMLKKKKLARAFRRPVSTALLESSAVPWQEEIC
ncbi:MAG: YlxR family protein [Deltaproteobacteria bacterium]|nr:YlxR family protein [Deltaproteobacteria bacterium]MBW2084510.1 YlxR family protein [Deltaproteobacteria bacterium]